MHPKVKNFLFLSYLVERIFLVDGPGPSGWRVGNDLPDRVPVAEEEVLECDVAVFVEVGVSVPEVAEYVELAGDKDDFDKLQEKFPWRLSSCNKLLNGVHEEEG